MIQAGYTPPAALNRVRSSALIAGVVLTPLLIIGAFVDRAQFFHAYLVAFIFWIGITLGSLALLCLQHLAGGAWGVVIRRVLEASTRTLPLMLLLFVPVAVGLKSIYPWTDASVMQSPVLQQKAAHYLNPAGFLTRAVVYFAIWSVLAIALNWLSVEQDRTADRRMRKRLQMISGPGLILFVLTTTFSSIDWVMSLDPTWSST